MFEDRIVWSTSGCNVQFIDGASNRMYKKWWVQGLGVSLTPEPIIFCTYDLNPPLNLYMKSDELHTRDRVRIYWAKGVRLTSHLTCYDIDIPEPIKFAVPSAVDDWKQIWKFAIYYIGCWQNVPPYRYWEDGRWQNGGWQNVSWQNVPDSCPPAHTPMETSNTHYTYKYTIRNNVII